MPRHYIKKPIEEHKKAGRKPDILPQEIQLRIIDLRKNRYYLAEIEADTGVSQWKLRQFLKSVAVK